MWNFEAMLALLKKRLDNPIVSELERLFQTAKQLVK